MASSTHAADPEKCVLPLSAAAESAGVLPGEEESQANVLLRNFPRTSDGEHD